MLISTGRTTCENIKQSRGINHRRFRMQSLYSPYFTHKSGGKGCQCAGSCGLLGDGLGWAVQVLYETEACVDSVRRRMTHRNERILSSLYIMHRTTTTSTHSISLCVYIIYISHMHACVSIRKRYWRKGGRSVSTCNMIYMCISVHVYVCMCACV